MALKFRPCKFEHIALIDPIEYQAKEKKIFMTTGRNVLALSSFKVSVWNGTECIGAGGILPIHEGQRAIAWSLFGKNSGKHMLRLKRAAKRHLDWDPTKRIEFYVTEDFKDGKRWAEMLGFQCETPNGMKNHGPRGETQYMYSRIK